MSERTSLDVIQKICANCRFWNETGDGTFGECRRHPPVIVSAIIKYWEKDSDEGLDNYYASGSAVINGTNWPMVEMESWCGEWQIAPKLLGDPPS